VIWLLIWLVPWADWLGSNWLRLGASIVLFMAPGAIFSMLLVRDRFELPLHLLSGLAISVFGVSVLGLLGRVFQLPFSYIKPVFVFTGLIGLIVIHVRSRSTEAWAKPTQIPLTTLLILAVVIVASVLTTLQDRFDGDDFSNLANLTNWQHAKPLNFNENIFGTGNLDKLRFWLAMFAMNLAFLSEISALHGLLLLGFYLEPLLMAVAVLIIYFFYKQWLHSENQAVAALAFHFAFFFMLQDTQQIGPSVFWRLSEDKSFAAFILAPLFFIAIFNLMEEINLRHGVFSLFIGWGLALTHPIILAYCLFIIGVSSAIWLIPSKEYKKLWILMILIVTIVAPVAPLRFIETPSAPDTYDLDSALEASPAIQQTRIYYIEGTSFYGFHPQRIQIQPYAPRDNPLEIFFSWSYLWLTSIGLLWSFFNFRRRQTAPFIAASALLVLICLFPYTGWLVGKFVTARMLWRAPWLLPIGGFGTVLLSEFINFLLKKSGSRQKSSGELISLITVLSASLLLIWQFSTNGHRIKIQWQSFEALNEYKTELSRLAWAGEYLEVNIESPSLFIANPSIMNFLPGLSSKADIVLFRSPKFSGTYIPDPIELEDITIVIHNATSIDQRVDILKRFKIKYIFADKGYLKNFYANYPELFSVRKVDKFWLIEFHDNKP